ncbi:rho guanine nucleotide exchange factor, putative, partial [Entamoeba invadens IP1]
MADNEVLGTVPPAVPPRRQRSIAMHGSHHDSFTDKYTEKPAIALHSNLSQETSTMTVSSPQLHSPKSPRSLSFMSSQSENFAYVCDVAGNLVTSGNTINVIMKCLIKTESSPTPKESETELYDRIDNREMTSKDKEHYRRVVDEYYQTEITHIKGLEILKAVYLEPMMKVASKNDHEFLYDLLCQIDIIIQ